MKSPAAVDQNTTIEDLLERYPSMAGVFVRLGLPCLVCGEPVWGTVGELCEKHGRNPAEVLAALNAAAQDQDRQQETRRGER
ncbi:MAG: DUF1858 domain-containing protein [candidate division WOR-3 bacterium]